jgi:hypothetical protein
MLQNYNMTEQLLLYKNSFRWILAIVQQHFIVIHTVCILSFDVIPKMRSLSFSSTTGVVKIMVVIIIMLLIIIG